MEEIARSLPRVRRRSAGDAPTRVVLVGAARHIRQTAQMSTLSGNIAGRSVAKTPEIQGLSAVPMRAVRAIPSASRRWHSVRGVRWSETGFHRAPRFATNGRRFSQRGPLRDVSCDDREGTNRTELGPSRALPTAGRAGVEPGSRRDDLHFSHIRSLGQVAVGRLQIAVRMPFPSWAPGMDPVAVRMTIAQRARPKCFLFIESDLPALGAAVSG